MAHLHPLTEMVGAPGAVGNDPASGGFSGATLPPVLRQVGRQGARAAAFPAAKRGGARVRHLFNAAARRVQQGTNRVLRGGGVADHAVVMDGHRGVGERRGGVLRLSGKAFIDGFRPELRGVFGKHLVTVGAGHQDPLDPGCLQPGDHLAEGLQEKLLPAQVVGRLGTAIQHQSQLGDLPAQPLVYLEGCGRPRPRQGAPREKDRAAPLRQTVPAKAPRYAGALITEETLVLGKGAMAALDRLPAHFQEEGLRIEPFGADRGAEPAKAALEADHVFTGILRVIGEGNGLGSAVGVQETALGDADAAAGATAGFFGQQSREGFP